MLTLRVQSGQPLLGGELNLQSIAAVVLGGMSLFGGRKPVTRSYIQLVDDSGRLSKEDIAGFPGPISEITEVWDDEVRI